MHVLKIDIFMKEGGYLLKGDDNLKQRSFIMKYQCWYSDYNNGKSHKQRRRNKRLGNKKMRNKLKNEMPSSLDMIVISESEEE